MVKKAIVTLIACFMFVSCGDYIVKLPNDYSLVQVYPGSIHLYKNSIGIIIYSNVDKYAVLNNIIVGHVSLADNEPKKEYCKPGYFIVEMKNNIILQGMTKQDWLDSLRVKNVNEEPIMKSP